MRRRLAGAVLAVLAAGPTGAAASGGLMPYQMVRSLQLVQDRIADGDHAALPMQSRLLSIIDERLLATPAEEFADPRNLHALLIYGTSGGNPATLEAVVGRLGLEGQEFVLGNGVVRYARGDFSGAREILRGIEPLEIPDELAAPFALVTGSLVTQENPTEALRLFDLARLLSPGTLIEEAALRRSVAASASIENVERFSLASLQYVARFLHSPYASQFAEAFVSAVVAMHEKIDLAVIEEVTAKMNAEQAQTIYLRIARQSAIEGYRRLLDFASRNAEKYLAEQPEAADPRATLYANVASVTSENVGEVLATLKTIDPQRLSPNDRRLLQAATEIAEDVVSQPTPAEDVAAAPAEPVAVAAPAEERMTEEEDPADPAFVAATLDRLKAIDALLEEKP